MNFETADRYCSTIQLQLVMRDQVYGLSSVQSDYIYLRNPTLLPSGDAEVVMHVDGERRAWSVKLLHGAVPFDNEVAISIQS